MSIDCISVAHTSGSRYIRSYSKHTFSLRRYRQTAFQSICTNLDACFPGGSVVKNPPVKAEIAGDTDLIPTSGRFPWSRKGQPLQYSGLGNPMDRGAWWAMVKGLQRVRHNWVTKHERASCRQQRIGSQDTPHPCQHFPSFHSHYSGMYGAASLQFYFALL